MLRISPSLARTAFTFILSFGLAKGTAFLAALALPRLVDNQTYGVLELALTVGAFSASFLSLSVNGAAARLHLIDEAPHAQTILVGLCGWLAALALVGVAGVVALRGGPTYLVCAAILGLFGIQMASSTYTRMKGLIHASGWLDSAALLITAALALLLSCFGEATPRSFAWAMVAVAAVAAALSGIKLAQARFAELRIIAIEAARMGAPMMFYGFLTFAIFGTPRIAIAKALNLEDVVSFSLCARIALILVFIHQVLSTGFFRQLYQMDNTRVGHILAGWIVVLSGIALSFAVATRYLSGLLVMGTAVPSAAIVPLFPPIIVQTTLWVLNANVELYVNRDLIARKASFMLGGLCLVALAIGLVLRETGQLSLQTIIYTYAGLALVSLISQMSLLSRKGFAFGPAYTVLPFTFSPLLVGLLPVP